ncbi:MAG TPA: hypothetical protein ENJ95_11420 [Bacteroidetes bacterium]|nr:hypothetical protein [Bacteroidota bacterium]
MFKTLTISFLLLCATTPMLRAQQDSFFVQPKKLAVSDIIKPVEDDKGKIEIISGSRFAIAAGELPFSTHVITKEEIRQNSYETLVDALKMAPGIFTSQPGSAVEGETFLMRGLLGNAYTKILINDIPVKPPFLASMPIGAQLPVREAERIEVIYGAGAALYGADASAGVINIITTKSDKPVYMQADLSVGAGQYSSANVMFGGKWGRNKNILHYFAYGSNVLYENRKVRRNYFDNFNTGLYPWLILESIDFSKLPNYLGDSPILPQVNNMPHLSRKFGLNLKFKRLSLSLETMTRRDHSSIGLNPVAVSYGNPLTYTGETIQRINLNLFKKKENMNRKTDFTFIRYRLDNNSSTVFVQNRLAVELYRLAEANAKNTDPANAEALAPAIYQSYYDKYLRGARYQYAVSDEYRFEHVRNYRLLKTSSLTLGLNLKTATGVPSNNFLRKPYNEVFNSYFVSRGTVIGDTLSFSVPARGWYSSEGNAFGQFFYSGKIFNFAAGFNYSVFSDADLVNKGIGFESAFLPRLALLVKISEDINVRSSWGKAYRKPNIFYNANTYRISNTQETEVTRKFSRRLVAETTNSWESGFRLLTGKNVDFDFTYFVNKTDNLINYGRAVERIDEHFYEVFLGYSNARNATMKIKGGQFSSNISLFGKVTGRYAYSWTKSTLENGGLDGNFFLPQYSGKVWQVRLSYKPFPTTTLILDFRRTKNAKLAKASFDQRKETKFATLDLTGRYAFTDRFDTYFKIINLTNKLYPGIPASRTPDDLLNNPQFGIFAKIGMNYYIE